MTILKYFVTCLGKYSLFFTIRIPREITCQQFHLPSLYSSEGFWATLQESAFSNLVLMFKRAINAQLHYWTESDENNGHLKALLEMLKKLHRVRVNSNLHV
jgi:hypothetical protein